MARHGCRCKQDQGTAGLAAADTIDAAQHTSRKRGWHAAGALQLTYGGVARNVAVFDYIGAHGIASSGRRPGALEIGHPAQERGMNARA